MPVYTVDFYDFNPQGTIPTFGSFVWTGPGTYGGSATITDNEAGTGGLTLDDDSAGGERAFGDATTAAGSSFGVNMDAELAWTVLDSVTGESFQVVQLQVEGGGASGFYTLSEQPLVPGRSYQVQSYDSNPNASGGDIAFTYADFQPTGGDGVIDGTGRADVIDPDYLDAEGEGVDLSPLGPDDSIAAGAGDDTVTAGQGSDTVDAGDGADLVYGDYGSYSAAPATGELNWTQQGGNGTDLSAGFTQDTGEIDVTLAFVNDGNNAPLFEVDTQGQYVAPGEDYSSNSALYMFGNGDGATSTTVMSFAASSGASVEDEVQNVSFRVNDVDWGSGNHTDIFTVNAYDADGNPVAVSLTPGGGDTVSGNTVTAETLAEAPTSAGGSVLVEVAGPVAEIEVVYANLQGGTQAIWLTDVQFEAVRVANGDDSLLGGAGDDTLFGQEGADTLDGGADNDSLDGGAGADSLLGAGGADTLTGGDGADVLEGGDGADTLSGDAGADILFGGTGDDTLEGGAGADSLSGGAGMDYASYAGSDAGVTIDLETNSFSGGHATGDVDSGGIDGLIGSDFADSLTGYDAEGPGWTNIFYGGLGADTLDGRAGDDQLFGEEGADSLIGGDGDDLLDGGTGADTLEGGTGNDELTGGAGTDLLTGGSGSDAISGGGGDDRIDGGAEADKVDGGAGDDVIRGGTGADALSGGAGNDTIYAAQGDTINGGAGDDVITLVDLAEAGSGAIFIEGLTTGQSGGDRLDLNGLADRTTLNITSNAGGELTGTVQMLDGTLVNFSNIDSVICFTPGTRILTEADYRPIETLRPGDRLVTRDDGLQPLRWIGRSTVPARGSLAPIRIAPQVLPGAMAPLLVSPQHRLLIEGYRPQLLLGESEVFAAASHMVDGCDITREPHAKMGYIHLLLDRHQVIFAEGVATESFFVGDHALHAMATDAREDLFRHMPGLRADPSRYGETARTCLARHEVQALMAPPTPVAAAA
ncbi:Hint domain-containing protein [Pseudoponticoccus marisrubri]|uniref:Type I secretion protein n=1 Tax=Pseudoponticoccus marisrubri TaxID=1685382 RepID=A0A0W7WEW5_9RHOB|nr:Hint domain-containing protein [Pseudoponticoccus marisrubri]KUF09015.1 type I secretion protein [Pseudoponticoccus marisrubri]